MTTMMMTRKNLDLFAKAEQKEGAALDARRVYVQVR